VNYVTTSSKRAPILLESQTSVIRNGKKLITNYITDTPKEEQEIVNKSYVDNNFVKSNSSITLGTPVVTIKDNFTIDAKPNTFYNIKNNGEDSVNINIKDEDLYIEDMNKLILFTFDNDTSGNAALDLLERYVSEVGWRFIPD
jgi:hypothetical protein